MGHLSGIEEKREEHPRGRGRIFRRVLATGLVGGVSLVAVTSGASAQTPPVVNICAGPSVSLPVLTPVANLVDTSIVAATLNPLLGGLVGNINTNLVGALSGQQLAVSVLDGNGNLISVPSNNCAITVPNPNGITLGGGRIDGLGGNGNAGASAGSQSAIAIGNGSSTAAGIADAVAFGRGASTSVAGGVALGAGSVSSRLNAGTELFSGAALRTTLGTVSVGSAGNERQITNVAGGTAATDAVNVRQLSYVGTSLSTALGGGAGFSITTGTFTAPSYTISGTTYRDVGSALLALSAASGAPGAPGAAGTPGANGGPGSGLVQQITNNSPITIGATTGGTTINVAGTSGNRTITGVAPGAITATSSDAVNGAQLYSLDQSVVKYDVDPATGRRANSVTLAGGDPNTPVLLRNVAAGILDTDAANVGQVKASQTAAMAYTDQRASQTLSQANAYTDSQFSKLANGMSVLGQGVQQAKVEARQAAAVGLAAASLRYDDRPGKISLAAGGGGWHGQAAAAFGMGYTSPEGLARFNVTASTSGSDWGIGGGVSLTLN